MVKAVEGDAAFAAGIFKNCFGRGGDFTVVVEEPQCEDSCGSEVVKRVEFKVWSQLLASWSAVFDKMINTEEFVEQKTAQVVITDFSSGATEIFLRFLYSGIVEGPLETLVEVCAMADKCQVERLHQLCTQAFQKGLNPDNACQLFAAAARFRLEDLRRMALEEIWVKAEDVLKECPSISPELFEEILAPGLICMSHPDLRVVLQGWSSGRKRKAGEETILSSPLQPVIERHLERLNSPFGRIWATRTAHRTRISPLPRYLQKPFQEFPGTKRRYNVLFGLLSDGSFRTEELGLSFAKPEAIGGVLRQSSALLSEFGFNCMDAASRVRLSHGPLLRLGHARASPLPDLLFRGWCELASRCRLRKVQDRSRKCANPEPAPFLGEVVQARGSGRRLSQQLAHQRNPKGRSSCIDRPSHRLARV